MLLAYSERDPCYQTQGGGRGGLTLGFVIGPRWGREVGSNLE